MKVFVKTLILAGVCALSTLSNLGADPEKDIQILKRLETKFPEAMHMYHESRSGGKAHDQAMRAAISCKNGKGENIFHSIAPDPAYTEEINTLMSHDSVEPHAIFTKSYDEYTPLGLVAKHNPNAAEVFKNYLQRLGDITKQRHFISSPPGRRLLTLALAFNPNAAEVLNVVLSLLKFSPAILLHKNEYDETMLDISAASNPNFFRVIERYLSFLTIPEAFLFMEHTSILGLTAKSNPNPVPVFEILLPFCGDYKTQSMFIQKMLSRKTEFGSSGLALYLTTYLGQINEKIGKNIVIDDDLDKHLKKYTKPQQD